MDINKIMKSLTLEEKVGQMLMFAFHGTEYNEQLDFQINKLNVGGIIHFNRNIVSPEQVCKLNFDSQKHAKIPLFIGVDQEGGTVQRIIKGVTPFPGAMALASTNKSNEKLCYYVGNDLKNMNYNMVFAPVADVNNNSMNPVINSRSYSDNPKVVSKYVIQAFKGFQKAGILPTIKHFPGHGDTSVDSHVDLPTVKKTRKELKDIELMPFEKAIENGVDGIMVSHILYPTFDEKYPATLSYNIMTDYLKKELGYNGMIVSDSLTMGAINNHYTKEEVVALAVNGGMDLLIFCGKADINEQQEIYDAFINGIKKGVISIERVNESVLKILQYKNKYCNEVKSTYTYPSEEALKLGTKLSEDSISLVKSNNLLPINENEKVLVIFPKIKLFSLVDNKDDKYTTLGSVFKKYNNNRYIIDELIIDEETNINDLISVDLKSYDVIIFATYNVFKNDYQTKALSILNKEKTVVVAMRSPYDLMFLGDIKNYICIYEATELALNSLVKALIGENSFIGKIPVKIN